MRTCRSTVMAIRQPSLGPGSARHCSVAPGCMPDQGGATYLSKLRTRRRSQPQFLGRLDRSAGDLREHVLLPGRRSREPSAVIVVRRLVVEAGEPRQDDLVAQWQGGKVVLGNQGLEDGERLGAGVSEGREYLLCEEVHKAV